MTAAQQASLLALLAKLNDTVDQQQAQIDALTAEVQRLTVAPEESYRRKKEQAA